MRVLELISILLDAVVQPRCIGCEKVLFSNGGPLCAGCHRALPWWRRIDGCPRCGAAAPIARSTRHEHERIEFDGCTECLAGGSPLHASIALARYEGPLRRWIPGFKNARGPFGPAVPVRLAIDYLADMLASRVLIGRCRLPDLIVSVPLHPRRKRHRGFNHVDPIANRIARTLDLPFAPDALARRRDTSSQSRLFARARRENVGDAFRATHQLGSARTVWLVDDVLTTGSTLDAAGNALLEAGCDEVRALTLAATLPAHRAGKRKTAYHAAAANGRSTRIR